MYPGTWFTEQVGVKAPVVPRVSPELNLSRSGRIDLPGTENRTTFLLAHSREAL